jgi:hypothetical protein
MPCEAHETRVAIDECRELAVA